MQLLFVFVPAGGRSGRAKMKMAAPTWSSWLGQTRVTAAQHRVPPSPRGAPQGGLTIKGHPRVRGVLFPVTAPLWVCHGVVWRLLGFLLSVLLPALPSSTELLKAGKRHDPQMSLRAKKTRLLVITLSISDRAAQ